MKKKIIKTKDNVEVHVLFDCTEKEYEYYADSLKEVQKTGWKPSNTNVFIQDMRSGLDFCKSKYGISTAKLISYIKREMPHIDVEILKKKGD